MKILGNWFGLLKKAGSLVGGGRENVVYGIPLGLKLGEEKNTVNYRDSHMAHKDEQSPAIPALEPSKSGLHMIMI